MCAGELIFLGKVPSFVKLGGGPAAGFPALASIAGQPGKGNRPEGGGRRFLAAPRIFPWKSPLFAVWEVMPSFIYITDVFCPWCFGFAPVMQELAEEYRFPVRVLCGELVDEPTPTSKMGTPTLLAFFERLSATTGREIGKGFFELLTPEKSVLMDSRRSAELMAALKKLAPGYALEQMERFQDVFYVEGRDVLAPAVQADAASRWGVDASALAGALASEGVQGKAEKELEEAEARRKRLEKLRYHSDFKPEEFFPYLFDEPYVHYYDSLSIAPDSTLWIYRLQNISGTDTLYDGLRMIMVSDTLAVSDSVAAAVGTPAEKEKEDKLEQPLQRDQLKRVMNGKFISPVKNKDR